MPPIPVCADCGSAACNRIARSGQRHRPLPEDPIAVLQQMSAARLPAYERLADITVDVASDPKVTCDRVMQALRARAAAKRGRKAAGSGGILRRWWGGGW